jgi:hypothetical protein
MRCDRLLPVLAVVAGCAARQPPAASPRVERVPTPRVHVGDCATPDRDGVMSDRPDRRRADIDLDGDGQLESVVADRALCRGDNCYWNVFVRDHADHADSCERFAGAIAGAALAPTPGSGRWPEVRGYWGLGGDRLLIQTYQWLRGGYVLTDALLCRRQTDDRIVCAETDR